MSGMHAPEAVDDTNPDAAAAQLDALRRMGPDGRLRAGMAFSASMIAMSRAALRARHPEADETDLKLLWISENYGEPLADAVARRLGVTSWTRATNSPPR